MIEKLHFGIKNLQDLQFELQPMEKEEFRQLAHEHFKEQYPQSIDKVACD